MFCTINQWKTVEVNHQIKVHCMLWNCSIPNLTYLDVAILHLGHRTHINHRSFADPSLPCKRAFLRPHKSKFIHASEWQPWQQDHEFVCKPQRQICRQPSNHFNSGQLQAKQVTRQHMKLSHNATSWWVSAAGRCIPLGTLTLYIYKCVCEVKA